MSLPQSIVGKRHCRVLISGNINSDATRIDITHSVKALILWRELFPSHRLCHLDEKILPQKHCHRIPSRLFLLVMKDNLMICFVSKWVASKSSVKATISRSLIFFIVFTLFFDGIATLIKFNGWTGMVGVIGWVRAGLSKLLVGGKIHG